MKSTLLLLSGSVLFLALVYGTALSGNDSEAALPDPCTMLPGPVQANIEAFIKAECYTDWATQDAHLSGRRVGGVVYARHDSVKIYYSSDVQLWRQGDRGRIPNNSMIVALEYAPGTGNNTPLRAQSMVRWNGYSYDGWFWSTTNLTDNTRSSGGEFGYSACISCHGSANNDHLVFNWDASASPSTASWEPDDYLLWPRNVPTVTRTLPQPLAEADSAFLDYFKLLDVKAWKVQPFPPKDWDHVVADTSESRSFVTADQCAGCHNAGQKLSNTRPNMWYQDPESTDSNSVYRNYSPYAEWSASLNGLSGRDPIWHAQVEFERRLRPELDEFTFATCFVCHGAMAGRQLSNDTGAGPFDFNKRSYLYQSPEEPMGKYAALARDGVSCAVCHAVSDDGLGVDPKFVPDSTGGIKHLNIDELNSYTAQFVASPTFFSPHPSPKAIGMLRGLGRGSTEADHLSQSKLCGSCHTVIVPALDVEYGRTPGAGTSNPFEDPDVKMSYEQTTYFEWRNSAYENEINTNNAKNLNCQSCHMPAHEGHRNSNIESNRFPQVTGRAPDTQIDLEVEDSYYRHVLLGINRFVFGMYQQFTGLLGAQHLEADVPEQTLNPLLNAEDWINDHAENKSVEIRVVGLRESANNVEVDLEVTAFTGHKFPTGAGFRRAFIHFEVLDASGNVLWASGRFNSLGVIVDENNQPLPEESTLDPAATHPHYQVVTGQDQVQIYETRAIGSDHMLQGTVLGIWEEYKDNRILPLGWNPEEVEGGPSKNLKAMIPRLPGSDNANAPSDAPEYCIRSSTELGNLGYDPDYCDDEGAGNSQDHITYRVPLSSIPGWASVRAQVYYQSIPPYFLRNLFQTASADKYLSEGPDVQRAYHIASRLNLAGTPAENWAERLGAAATINKGGTPLDSLTRNEIWQKQQAWHLQHR